MMELHLLYQWLHMQNETMYKLKKETLVSRSVTKTNDSNRFNLVTINRHETDKSKFFNCTLYLQLRKI